MKLLDINDLQSVRRCEKQNEGAQTIKNPLHEEMTTFTVRT